MASKLTLEIPADVVDAAKLPAAELERESRRELAVALYGRGVLPLGKARVLAQMERWEFEELLGQRGITRHFGGDELDEDLRYAWALTAAGRTPSPELTATWRYVGAVSGRRYHSPRSIF